jgi:beta-mannosidase
MTLLKKLQIVAISDQIGVVDKPITVRMNIRRFDDFRIVNSLDWHATLKANDATLVDEFDIFDYMTHNKYDVNENMAEFLLIDHDDENLDDHTENVLSSTFVFPARSFKNLRSVGDPKPELKIAASKCEKGFHKISLEVKIQAPAIFMSITVAHDKIDKHQVSKNGFMQFEPVQVLQVTFPNPQCQQTVTTTNFEVKTLNQFLLQS